MTDHEKYHEWKLQYLKNDGPKSQTVI